MKRNRQIILLCITIFTGGVFFTSGKFVNETNTPKIYFVVATLLVAATMTAIYKNRINLSIFYSKTVLWGINIICFLQACYGLCQYTGWLTSNHSRFAITGSFDNPAGFAAVLAMGFPIGLFLHTKAKRPEKYLAGATLIVIVTAVSLSCSRTGILAIIVSSVVFSMFKTNVISKFQQYRYYKLLTVLIMVCFVSGAFILYYQKKDSANGRLLIWKVSSEMIKDKLIFGHGYGKFLAKYMDYQAEYFKSNPNSKFELLADNVKHPFNEFIKVTVEFGIAGLVITFSLMLFIFRKIIKSKHKNSELVLSGLASFFVFACFSYPLQYVAVWLLLAFYLSIFLLLKKEITLKNITIPIIVRGIIIIECVFSLFYIFRQMSAEIKWKTIAVNSLGGNTEEMLPEYTKLYSTVLKRNPFFLYNFGAELNSAGRFDKSIKVLTECQHHFNDYDIQILLADNYYKIGEYEKATESYQHASNMIPCRFMPLLGLLGIYKELGNKDMATKYANEIINKQVKIPSGTVSYIQNEARIFLNENGL